VLYWNARGCTGNWIVVAPACWKSSVTEMDPPLESGLARPLITTEGDGPVRLTELSAGRFTPPPVSCAFAAVPGAVTLTSLSALPLLKNERNRLADEPAGSAPDGAPSTKASLIEIPLKVV
jgi:hypothetical protein